MADRYDPVHAVDYAMLGVGSAVFLVNISAFITIALNDHHFVPFRTKNTFVMGLALATAVCWWYGSFFYQGGMFGVDNLSLCRITGIWFRWALGGFAYLCIMLYRLLVLYQILIRKRPARSLWILLLPAVVYTPGVVIAILPTVMTSLLDLQTVTDRTGTNNHYCDLSTPIVALMWAYCGLLILLLAIFAIRIRHIKSTFNEFREVTWALIPLVVTIAVTAGLANSPYSHMYWSRLICNLTNLFAAVSFFWAVYGPSFFGFLFRRDAYLRRFNATLVRDGFQTIGSDTGHRGPSSSVTDCHRLPDKPHYLSASTLPVPSFDSLTAATSAALMSSHRRNESSDSRSLVIPVSVAGRHLIS
ncbi:hypothetical protein IWQ60_001918 [Tieghemiomyces parasiticus]|uniref:Uncharacterized protein n=1 Tax=Tieghemiomyces parasiticus TaxID=78921 RepID=A0A9W8E1G5_9FUNG|nr:hypothetical protein IWQ60_001918 [Tieghemiomyces parasiticus]